MQIICPECHALHDFKVPLPEYTIKCTKCSSLFLTPMEALPEALKSQENLSASLKRLEDAYTQERHQLESRLEERYRRSRRHAEQELEREEAERKRTREAADESIVKHSIANKLLTIVLTIYFLAVIIVNGILMVNQYYSTKNLILEDLRSTEKIFGRGLAEAIWNMDDTGVQAIINGMLEHPVIVGVRITGDGSEGYVSKGRTTDFWHTFPILYTSEDGTKTVTGNATVYSDTGLILKRVKMGYWLLGINGVTVAVVLTIAFLWVSRNLLRQPLSMLTNAVSSLNLESLDSLEVRVNTTARNELKILEESFNQMVHNLIDERKTILQMSSTFEKFIPKQFLSRIAEQGIGTIKLGSMDSERLSILYAEIQSYDGITEQLDAESQYEFLNAYLAAMEVPIEKHGGFIFQLNKTAIMALFTLNDHSMEALSAVYAAIDMQKAVQEFNGEQLDLSYPSISIGIGIHSGDVVLGTLGNETRLESTAIGESIESAIRLQELTDQYGSQVLISHSTFSLLESLDAFQWRELDAVHLQSEADTIQIYEVFDADPAAGIKQQILKTFHRGIESFRNQDWKEAEDAFEMCLKTYPVDVVSQMYIKRCKGYLTDDEGIVAFLKDESEVFASLDDVSIAEISQHFTVTRYERDETVIRYGEIGHIFYIVRSGSLEVVLQGEDGRDVSVAALSKGDCFAEMSLMTGDPAMATIRGITSGDLLALNQDQFESMLRDFPTLNSYFRKLFLERLVEDKNKIAYTV